MNIFNKFSILQNKEKKKTSILDLCIDVICCWLITCAIVPLLYVQFIEFSLNTVFIAAACILIVLALITRTRWLLPALLGTGFIGGFMYLLFSGKLGWFFRYVRGFFFWLLSNMNNSNETYATETNYLIVQIAICIGVALIVFFFIRTSHSFLVVIGTAVLYFVFLLNGYRDYNTLTLMFLAVGYMPIIASSAYRKRKPISRFIKQRETNIITPTWLVQITAIILCVASIFVSLLVVPEDTSNMIYRFATNAVADLQSATNLYTKEQKQTEYKNLGYLNLQRFSNIGGQLFTYDPEQNEPEFENKTVAYVYGASSGETYLKTAVYENYNGSMWTSEFSKAYRLGSPFFGSIEDSVFNKFESDNENLSALYKSLTTERTITVSLAESSNKLLVPSGIVSFAEKTSTKIPVLYNLQSEIMSFKNQIADFKYEVTYKDASVNLEKIKSIMDILNKTDSKVVLNEEDYDTYTALPDNYSLAVTNYAKKITSGSTSKYQSVAMLVLHLTDIETFTYVNDKTLKAVPQGTDIAIQLLRSKRGNSVYYASTLATMARSLGIPSRLVAGYRVSGSESLLNTSVWNKELGAYEISEDDAFCWTECFIDGIGWIAFYPSPVTISKGGSSHSSPDTPSSPDIDDMLPPKSELTPEDLPEEKPEDETKPMGFWEIVLLVLKVILYIAAAVLAVALLLLVRSLFAFRFSALSSVKHRFKSKHKQAEYYLYDIIKQLKAIKISVSPASSAADIAEMVAQLSCADDINSVLNIIDKIHFANNYSPSDEEIAEIYSAHQKLEKEVKSKLTPFKYFLKRKYFRTDKTIYSLNRLIRKIKR